MYFRFGGRHLGFAENLNIIYITKFSITISCAFSDWRTSLDITGTVSRRGCEAVVDVSAASVEDAVRSYLRL